MLEDFPIDKGIPLPRAKHGGNSGQTKWPFPLMAPGDSFLIRSLREGFYINQTANGYQARNPGTLFSIRLVTYEGPDGQPLDGIRVWCIKQRPDLRPAEIAIDSIVDGIFQHMQRKA